MKIWFRCPFFFISFFVLILSACVPVPVPITGPTPGDNPALTAAVQTVSVLETQAAINTLVSEVTRLSAVSATPTLTLTPEATATPTVTATPIPPTFTPTPLPCYYAQFVADVTVSDAEDFDPGEDFTKTWRLKNAGICTWTRDYDLVFLRGEHMSGPESVALPRDVPPGETVDLSVDLTAPPREGTYTGYWQLRADNGTTFGLGTRTIDPFWVKIDVVRPARTPQIAYEFTNSYCDATWRTSYIDGLACPGLPGFDPNTEPGFVYLHPEPVMENGYHDDEPALVTYPNAGNNGVITGTFPAIEIRSGDRFRAAVGCLVDRVSCDVKFQLNYRINGGPLQNLGIWAEKYDNNISFIDVDLSALNGQNVQFVLTVVNNGNNEEDWAFWLRPRIMR